MKRFAPIDNRLDLGIIASLIEENTWVLDLGCGNGGLLEYLINKKRVKGMGVDINIDKIIECIKKGIPVIQQDLNKGLGNFKDKSFDYVVLSQTLQVVHHPEQLVEDMLRVGTYSLVSFPNFGYYQLSTSLLLRGRMPKSKALPYEWYDTPNIHQLTIKDFREFCRRKNITIIKEYHTYSNRISSNKFLANKLSQGCVALITK